MRTSHRIFSKYAFTEFDVRSIEGNLLNGMSIEEIADKIYGVLPQTWKLNLSRSVNHWVKERLKSATEKALGSTANNLRKLADGFMITEREFSAIPGPNNLEKRSELIRFLQEENDKEFWDIILSSIKIGNESRIKVRIKEIPPDFKANQLILQAHSPEVWDLEGNRKKIPDVKIVVGIEGESAKKFLKQKAIKADYEIQPKLMVIEGVSK